MFLNSIFASPVPAFPNPVRRPVGEPGASPTVTVTFACEWMPWVLACIRQLVLQATWEGTESEVNLVQERAMELCSIFQLAAMQCGNPPMAAPVPGMEVNLDMGLRVDCNCNVFVTCCDGTEVQLLTTKFPGTPQPGQPGAGSPFSPPGGAPATNCYTMDAAEQLQLTQRVSSGDVLRFKDLTGSWYDNATLNFLKCPDGWFFAFGSCGEDITRNPLDPMPTLPGMSLYADIGGTNYDVLNLDAQGNTRDFVVPPGISDQPVIMKANSQDTSHCFGSVGFCVTYTNNAPKAWAHDFDFTQSPNTANWSIVSDSFFTGPTGEWIPGIGYRTTLNPETVSGRQNRIVRIKGPAIANMTRFEARFTYTPGTFTSPTGDTYSLEDLDTTFLQQVASPTTPTSPQIYATPTAVPHAISLGLIAGQDPTVDPGGAAALTFVHVEGTGPDPFI